MSQSAIGNLLDTIENLLTDVFNGIADFIEAGINELVNYAPTLVDIGVVTAVAVGIGYAFKNVLTSVPFIGNLINGLGRLLRL